MFGLFDPRTLDADSRTIHFVQADNGHRHKLAIGSAHIAEGVARALDRQGRDGMSAIVVFPGGNEVKTVGLTVYEGVLKRKAKSVTMDVYAVHAEGKHEQKIITDVPVVLNKSAAIPSGRLAASVSGYLGQGGIRVCRLLAEPVLEPSPHTAPTLA